VSFSYRCRNCDVEWKLCELCRDVDPVVVIVNVLATLVIASVVLTDMCVCSQNELDCSVVWNATIQYSARREPLSVHKLFISCVRRCLVLRACDCVMSALSAALLIFSFQLPSGNQRNRALFTGQKNSSASQTFTTARIAPKICKGQPPTMY